ncbi:MAG TPA: hypothetical protein VFC79_07190 [Tissierellaceae bacterium]|nr:hypothetical protein [Tissierellaceae bacterium]
MTNNKCIVCGLPLTCTRCNDNDSEEINGTYDQLDLELKSKMLVEIRSLTKELEKIRKTLDKK